MTISTVGSARTYTTWQAWEDAALAVLLAPWEAEAYIDNGTWFTTNGTTLTFAGITSSPTNFLEARPASGQGFATGIGAAGPLRADLTKGVGLQNTNNYGHACLVQTENTTIRGLQLITTGNGGDAAYYANNAFETYVTDCIIEGQGASNVGQLARFTGGDMTSCYLLAHSARSAGIGFQDWISGDGVINCTIAIPADDSDGTNAFHVNSGTVPVKNSAFFGFTNDTNNDGAFTGSNNASDVAIGFGSSNQASVTYADQFENVNYATRDYRAKAASALLSNATSTGAPSTDIIGQAFTNTIGAWQYQSAGPTASATFFAYTRNSLTAGAIS